MLGEGPSCSSGTSSQLSASAMTLPPNQAPVRGHRGVAPPGAPRPGGAVWVGTALGPGPFAPGVGVGQG